MNRSIIVRPLASAAVLALVPVGQPGFATLSQAASLVSPQAAVQVEVEGRITAVNLAAGTITVRDRDRPATVVALGAARGPYRAWQKVKVYGIVTQAATMRAHFIRIKGAPAPTAARPVGAYAKVEGRITAVNAAAGTITVQDGDGPPTVVALGAARGGYYVWQKVKVYGTVTKAATVRAQFIRLKLAPARTVTPPVGAYVKMEGRITAVNAAAGTITVRDDDRPPTVVTLGTATGRYYVWQKVEVYGIVTNAGSNGVSVRAQFIRLES
jgi:hypothetical protein